MSRQKELPKVLSSDERAAFLGTFNRRYQGSFRNLVAARLMLDCGLRAGEVVALRPEHVSLESRRLMVREGKGAKDRVLYMSAELRDLIADWLERRPGGPWLVGTRDGGQLDTRYLRTMVKRQACKAGIAECERISPHTLRHSFATQLYRETKDLIAVKEALGHEDIGTTQIYAHLANGEVEAGMRGLWGQDDRDEAARQAEIDELAEGILEVLPADVRAALRRRLEDGE